MNRLFLALSLVWSHRMTSRELPVNETQETKFLIGYHLQNFLRIILPRTIVVITVTPWEAMMTLYIAVEITDFTLTAAAELYTMRSASTTVCATHTWGMKGTFRAQTSLHLFMVMAIPTAI